MENKMEKMGKNEDGVAGFEVTTHDVTTNSGYQTLFPIDSRWAWLKRELWSSNLGKHDDAKDRKRKCCLWTQDLVRDLISQK